MSKATTETMKETEIRPDDLMKGQAERFNADIRRYMSHKDQFIHVHCPACDSDDNRPAFKKYGDLNYVECQRCETVYINPRPTPELIEKYYSTSENYQYWNKYIFPVSEKARREKIFKPRVTRLLEICERNNIATNMLLEVGAGFGTFCEEMKSRNVFKRVVAVEPTPDLAETCKKRGLEVIDRPIEKVELDNNSADVVASFEVIEHLFDPRRFVANCAAVLSKGGILVLTCPSIKGFDIETLQEHSNAVDIEHLNYFHPASLSALVEKCGLKTIEVMTPGKLDAELVRKKVLDGEISLDHQRFLKNILIDRWEELGAKFQDFLAENNLSSHLWLVAQKN